MYIGQGSTIWFVGSLISFLASLFFPGWLFWVDGINKCGWCLGGGKGCWLKGLHQIPSVSWLCHHSLHLHIYQIVSFVPRMPCPLYCFYKWWGDGISGGWLIYIRVWVGVQGVGIFCCFLFFPCAFVCCCLLFSVPIFRLLEDDDCCVCFFVFSLFSLSLVPWSL